jgi:hypothetical protein
MVMQRSLIQAGATLRVRCERWRTMRHLSFTQSNDALMEQRPGQNISGPEVK